MKVYIFKFFLLKNAIKNTLKEDLIETSDSDPFKFYYMPIVKIPLLQRLKSAVKLLGKKKYNKLLDLGCGAGVLLPELSKHADILHGTDVHDNLDTVESMVKTEGIKAKIFKSDVLKANTFKDKYDSIVCVSVLEHIHDVELAIKNIDKILEKDGEVIFGFPPKNPLVDLVTKILVPNIEEHHVSSHQKILREISKKMRIVKFNNIPSFIKNPKWAIYVVCKAVKK
ncbi:MAG: class I SAM-dependent methyltransferase [Bacteriovoracaceae bacterium]|nr:class I SAM-dependent methyltransferase [Bacteriovoracaceae bacterium]